nr:hypothetical protein [Tanacetum cinerariifolium]
MPYPKFTKAITQYFISKDKTISMRNKLFMHTIKDGSVLGGLKFVSKHEDSQVYDPNAALGLAKSISRTEAEEIEAARLVHETHERIVTEKSTGTRKQTCVVFKDNIFNSYTNIRGLCHEPNSEGSGSAWKAYMNARVAGLFLLVLLEYPNAHSMEAKRSNGLIQMVDDSHCTLDLKSPKRSKAKSFEGCRSSMRMTMHKVVHEMVVGECHEPNSKGSGSSWKAYMNARVAGLFLLVLLEYPNGKSTSSLSWPCYTLTCDSLASDPEYYKLKYSRSLLKKKSTSTMRQPRDSCKGRGLLRS